MAYRLDMLSPSERKLIEEHLTICPQCQQALQVAREIDDILSTPMDPGNIEDVIIWKLRLHNEISARWWWQYPLWVCLNTLAAFAAGFGIWIIFINTQPKHVSWLHTLIAVLENSMTTTAGMFLTYGCGALFLLGSLFYAFRKSIVKYLIEF